MKTLKQLLVTGALIAGSGLANSKEADAQYPIIPFSQPPPIIEVGPPIHISPPIEIYPISPLPIEVHPPLPPIPFDSLPPDPSHLNTLPPRTKHNLMDKIKGTGWKEVSEILPIGKNPDDSKGDYLRIGKKGKILEIIDGNDKKSTRRIKGYETNPKNRDKLRVFTDRGSLVFEFNRSRTKASLTFSDKVVEYERYFPKPMPEKHSPWHPHPLMQGIWWTDWKEVSENPLKNGSRGDYISFGKNWELEFVDGNKHIKRRIVKYQTPKNDQLDIYDGNEWHSIHFNKKTPNRISIVVDGKINNYEKR